MVTILEVVQAVVVEEAEVVEVEEEGSNKDKDRDSGIHQVVTGDEIKEEV